MPIWVKCGRLAGHKQGHTTHPIQHSTHTKVFAKAGLDIVTSAMCKHQQRFGLDVQCSASVRDFNNIFSNEHLYRAGESMNSLPSQILERWRQVY